MTSNLKVIKDKFIEVFSSKPILVKSPGRVNIIGEHTDYNGGFVLPAAVDKSIDFAILPSGSKQCKMYAFDLDEYHEFEIDNPIQSKKQWPNYLMGVVDELKNAGYEPSGFNCVFGGNVPSGAGMSSSAAIEGGLAFALNHIFDLGIKKIDLVKFAQKAENNFVGVNCGIMDQFINIFGEDKKLLKIDCRSLDYEYVPFEKEDLRIVLCNTMVTHSLASSEYNVRRLQCEEGIKLLAGLNPEIKSLRDVSKEFLFEHKDKFDPLIFQRCKYVVEENIRLKNACEYFAKGDFTSAGEMMNQSHYGLSKEYEVSCKELDFLAEAAQKIEGVLGSRMMGGGFGGCTINLVEDKFTESFTKTISEKYFSEFNVKPEIYISKIEQGTRIIEN
ncbi:MAG: galactokinase [Rhodothermaceae bacterium]